MERRLEALKLQRQEIRHEFELNAKSLDRSKQSLNESTLELSGSKSRVADLQVCVKFIKEMNMIVKN